jgi:OOP family OmpA-OmpF porin
VVAAPFAWRLVRTGQTLRLTGVVPSARAKARLVSAAAAAFPNASPPIDETTLAVGAPSPRWTEIAIDAIRQFARLNGDGEVRLIDDRIVVLGQGGGDAPDAIRAHYRTPPAPFSVRVDVIAPSGAAASAFEGLNLAEGGADACAEVFARVMADNVINFATNSAVIDPGSAATLDTLAQVALRCDQFSIEVSGHTDIQGERAANMALSQARAEAVLAYLADQGVARARLSAAGYGPDRPRASNATETGRAVNRRIEFNVTE